MVGVLPDGFGDGDAPELRAAGVTGAAFSTGLDLALVACFFDLVGEFQYHSIWKARIKFKLNPAQNPYRISWSSTSWSVVKIRDREPAR